MDTVGHDARGAADMDGDNGDGGAEVGRSYLVDRVACRRWQGKRGQPGPLQAGGNRTALRQNSLPSGSVSTIQPTQSSCPRARGRPSCSARPAWPADRRARPGPGEALLLTWLGFGTVVKYSRGRPVTAGPVLDPGTGWHGTGSYAGKGGHQASRHAQNVIRTRNPTHAFMLARFFRDDCSRWPHARQRERSSREADLDDESAPLTGVDKESRPVGLGDRLDDG